MTTSYLYRLRMIRRDAWLVLCMYALLGLTFNGLGAVLYNLYLLRLGFGTPFIGLVNAVGAFAFGGVSILAGVMGLRWNSRVLMLAGAALLVVGYALTPMVEWLPAAWRSAWLLGDQGALWAGAASFMVGSNPFLMRVTTPVERDHVFGLGTSLLPLGGFVGSLLGGILPQALAGLLGVTTQAPAPYRYALWLLPVIMAPGILSAWHTQARDAEQTAERPQSTGGRLPVGVVGMIGAVLLLRWVGQAPPTVFMNVYLDAGLHSPMPVIGALMAFGKLMGVPAGLLMPLITARWGHFRTLVWGMVASGLSLLPIALVPHWTGAAVGFVGMSALFSITGPTSAVFSQQLVVPRWRALMAGVSGLMNGLGYGGAALAGGFIIAGLGYEALFLYGAAAGVASGALLWAYFRTPRGELRPAAPARGVAGGV